MPLIEDPGVTGAGVSNPALPNEANFPREPTTPGWMEVIGAEFETNNSITSIAADQSGVTSRFMAQPFDPDFDLGAALKGTKWENNPGLFVTARNADHVRALQADHERDERNRQILNDSTWGQYLPAMIGAQVMDPINWLSLGTAGVMKFVGTKGFTLATRTGAITAGTAIDTALQEGVLQATQVNRTMGESLAGIGGSMIVGSLLGHVGSRLLLREESEAFAKVIKEEIAAFERGERATGNITGDAAGVGAERAWNADGTPSPRMKFSFGADYLSQRMGPQQRLTHSESDVARRFINELAETPYFYRENAGGFIVAPRGDAMGMPGSVQTRIGSVWEEPIMQAIYGMRDLYLEYRGAQHQNFAQRAAFNVRDRFGQTDGALSEVQFRQAVNDAVNNGGAHTIPQVAKAAQQVLKLIDQVQQSGQKAGVLKEGQSAIPRSWLTARITGERPKFRSIVVEHLRRRRAVMEDQWAQAQREIEQKAKQQEDVTADQRWDREMRNARDMAEREAERDAPLRYEGLPLAREEIETVVEFWRYVREIDARKKPENLTSFIVRLGGLEDPGGDVLGMLGSHRQRPGLVRKGPSEDGPGMAGLGAKEGSGRTLDDWAHRAWEAGFFPDHVERPTINEFLERLGDDLQSNRVVRQADEGYFDDLQVADDMARELEGYGISARQFRKEETIREFFGEKRAAKDADAARPAEGSIPAAPKLTAEQERLKQRATMVDAELENLADTIIERITLSREGRTAHDLHTVRDADGFMKDDALISHEDFAIPYAEVRDFLETDIELLTRIMHRSMIPDIEIAHRFGSADASDFLRSRIEEGTRAINAATDPKERLKLEKRLKRDLQDMADARDRLAGRYGLPADPAAPMVRAGRFLRDASIVQKMGMSAFASIPETARLITARGISGLFGDLIYPMVRDFAKLAEAGHDLRMATHAMDHHTASRAMAIADGAEDWGNIPKVDRFSREATKTFMRATGLPKLTDWQKSAGGILVSKTILEAAEAMKAGKATQKQVEFLSRLAISKDNAIAIADQFKKHGVKDDARVWAAEANKWDPEARTAREAFLGGIRREVNRLITTPGLDTPNMTQNEVGRIFFQYKGFALSAYERVLVSGLQQNDVAFWSSAVAAIGMAFLVNEGRKSVFERNDGKRKKSFDERWNDPRERNQMFIDAVDRSGVIGWLPEINTVMDRVFGAGLSSGMGVVQRQPGISRPADAMRQLAGPAISSGIDTTLTGTKLAASLAGWQRWSESDTRQLERVIPFIGLHWMRLGLEQLGAEEAINKAMNARRSGR